MNIPTVPHSKCIFTSYCFTVLEHYVLLRSSTFYCSTIHRPYSNLKFLIFSYIIWFAVFLYCNNSVITGRVVAVDWVVPKSQYEEAKLVGVQDDSPEEEGDQDDQEDNDEDPASSDQQEDQQSDQGDQHSDQEIQQSDQEDQLSDQEDNTSDVMSEDVGSDDDDDVNDEEDEDNDMLTDHDKSKPRTPSHKRKLTNDVSEGRTVFIR